MCLSNTMCFRQNQNTEQSERIPTNACVMRAFPHTAFIIHYLNYNQSLTATLHRMRVVILKFQYYPIVCYHRRKNNFE